MYCHVGSNRPFRADTERVVDSEILAGIRISVDEIGRLLARLEERNLIVRPGHGTVALTEAGVAYAATIVRSGHGTTLLDRLNAPPAFHGSDGFHVGRLMRLVNDTLHWSGPGWLVTGTADVAPLRAGERHTDVTGPGYAISQLNKTVRGVLVIATTDGRRAAIEVQLKMVDVEDWHLRFGAIDLNSALDEAEYLQKVTHFLAEKLPSTAG
jgi:hypothetical protein